MDEYWKWLASLLLGFALAQLPAAWDRRRKLRTHWRALRAELRECDRLAEILRTAKIGAPLYRLPDVAYKAAFPLLLGEGAVTEQEYSCIARCYAQIGDINRGLDGDARIEMGDMIAMSKLAIEYERLCLKAAELLDGKSGDGGLLASALQVVDVKASRGLWHY
jgi:hypothetical protein